MSYLGQVINTVNLCTGCTGTIGCTPTSATIDTVMPVWNQQDCLQAFNIYININDTIPQNSYIKYNPAFQSALQTKLSHLFSLYLDKYSFTDNVTSTSFNLFQDRLLETCTELNLPGVCGQSLTGFCGQTGRAAIQESSILTSFCGCYTTPDPNFLNITHNPACDPLCRRIDVSKKAIDATGQLIECDQNICSIDDININVINSNIIGGVNFNTVCSGCSTGTTGATGPGCLCIIKSTDINNTLNQIGVGQNFNQVCGGQSVCLVQGPTGTTQVPCETTVNDIAINAGYQGPNIGLVVLMILLVIIVIVIVIAGRSLK